MLTIVDDKAYNFEIHRVRFSRKSPKSTKRFSQSELAFRYNNELINQYE